MYFILQMVAIVSLPFSVNAEKNMTTKITKYKIIRVDKFSFF